MKHMALPGLERLLAICGRSGVSACIKPPCRTPPRVGQIVGGYPLDPALAAFYARCGGASFASDIYLLRGNDDKDQLEERSQQWREEWQDRVGMPLFIFGGVSSLAYSFATVPGMADEQGLQPIVQVDTYELDGPVLIPLASNVDRLFDTYSRYLEELVAHEDFQERGTGALSFPWKVPHLLARDDRLVQLLREGHFAPLFPGLEGQAWVASIVAAHQRRS